MVTLKGWLRSRACDVEGLVEIEGKVQRWGRRGGRGWGSRGVGGVRGGVLALGW